MPGLGQLIGGRAETVDDMSFKQRGVFIKADDAAARCQMGGDVRGGSAGCPGNDGDRGLGGVVAVFHAGGLGLFAVRQLLPHRLIHGHLAQYVLQCFQRQPAGTEETGRRHRQVDDGALYAHGAGAAVHDTVDLAVHILQHVLGGGGAGPPRGVAAGCGHGDAGRANDGQGHGMIGAADAHRVQAAGGAQGHVVPAGQDHGERPRPEPLRQGIGHRRDIAAVPLQPVGAGDMEDQRVVLGTALCLENMQHGVLVQRVGAETVHRLGGDAQQAAPPQYGGGFGDGVFVLFRVENLCLQGDSSFHRNREE